MLTQRVRSLVDHAEAVAVEHGGVLSRRELRDLGVGRGVVARLVRESRWALLGRHTVATHCGPPGTQALRWRAVHEVGGDARVDGVSALCAAGMTGVDDEQVHVSVHMLQRAPEVEGVLVHKLARRLPGEGRLAGLPRTPPALASLRAAQWAVTDRQAALFLTVPVQQRLATGEQLREVAGDYLGRRRRAFVTTIIDDLVDGAHSLGELDFAVLCRRRGLPEPERQVVVRTRNGRCYLDVRWRQGLAVEVDGSQHLVGRAPIEDMLRQNEVSMRGDMVLRIPLLGLRTDPEAFLDQVEEALRLLEHLGQKTSRTS